MILLVTLVATPAGAAGGSSTSFPADPTLDAPKSPEELSASYYNKGLKLRDKAWKLEEKAEAAGSD